MPACLHTEAKGGVSRLVSGNGVKHDFDMG
jgi:hypothetical protein